VRSAPRLLAAGPRGAGSGDARPRSALLARAAAERSPARSPAGGAGTAGGGGGVRLVPRLHHSRAPAWRGEGAGGSAGGGGRLLRRAHAAHRGEAGGGLRAPPEAPEALAGVPRTTSPGAGSGARACRGASGSGLHARGASRSPRGRAGRLRHRPLGAAGGGTAGREGRRPESAAGV